MKKSIINIFIAAKNFYGNYHKLKRSEFTKKPKEIQNHKAHNAEVSRAVGVGLTDQLCAILERLVMLIFLVTAKHSKNSFDLAAPVS